MFKGVNASDGFGIGVAQVAVAPDLSFTPSVPEDTEQEKARYEAALKLFVSQTNNQIERMTQSVGEEAAAIMGAHIEFAEDEGIKDMVSGSIDAGMCAEQAVSEAYDQYCTMFSQMDDPSSASVPPTWQTSRPGFWPTSSASRWWTSPRSQRTPSWSCMSSPPP